MQISSTTAVQPAQTTASSPRQSTPSTAKAAVAPTVQAAQAQASSSASSVVSQTYSTSVGGKNYSGNVQQSGGQYTVSVPNLPGASASASSLQSAENALNVKIHILA